MSSLPHHLCWPLPRRPLRLLAPEPLGGDVRALNLPGGDRWAGVVPGGRPDRLSRRDLPVCDVLQLHGGRRVHRPGHPAPEHRRGLWRGEGLHHPRGRRRLPHRADQRESPAPGTLWALGAGAGNEALEALCFRSLAPQGPPGRTPQLRKGPGPYLGSILGGLGQPGFPSRPSEDGLEAAPRPRPAASPASWVFLEAGDTSSLLPHMASRPRGQQDTRLLSWAKL